MCSSVTELFPTHLYHFSHVSILQIQLHWLLVFICSRKISKELCQSFFCDFIQANFFYFCDLLGATYSSIWRWLSEWKIWAFCIWPSNSHSVENKVLLTLKIIWLSDLFCRSALLYPFSNGLIMSGCMPLHNTSQKKQAMFIFSSIVHLLFLSGKILFSFSSF